VGSNPTLSAISTISQSNSTINIRATVCYIYCGNCRALHGLAGRKPNGNSNCLLPAQNWRCVALLSIGYRPQARSRKARPLFIRIRNAARKYQWVKHETEAGARKAAKLAPDAQKARELGLTVDEVSNTANSDRTSIKTAIETYLYERRFGRPRSIKAYENVFDQLLANLPQSVRFIDQLAVPSRLNAYVEFLRGLDYSNKTISNRMGFIFSLLKANGTAKSSKLVKLPKVQLTRTKAYNPDELSKLFAAMTPEEYLRYLFLVRTGSSIGEVASSVFASPTRRVKSPRTRTRYDTSGCAPTAPRHIPLSITEAMLRSSCDGSSSFRGESGGLVRVFSREAILKKNQ
jgi:hypothetical protein